MQCVCVWLLRAVWCLWVIMALTPFPFIPGLLATASGRRNHMMGPFYLSEQFYPPFLISPVNLSQFSVLYSFKISIEVISVSCFDKFTCSLALTRKNWGTRGDIWSHITLRWMGWNWVWYIFEPILLYNVLVWVGFERYLRPYYYTMDRLELGLIYIRTLASLVHVGTFELCAAKICSSSNLSFFTRNQADNRKRILTNQDDNSVNHFNIIERLPLVFR